MQSARMWHCRIIHKGVKHKKTKQVSGSVVRAWSRIRMTLFWTVWLQLVPIHRPVHHEVTMHAYSISWYWCNVSDRNQKTKQGYLFELWEVKRITKIIKIALVSVLSSGPKSFTFKVSKYKNCARNKIKYARWYIKQLLHCKEESVCTSN